MFTSAHAVQIFMFVHMCIDAQVFDRVLPCMRLYSGVFFIIFFVSTLEFLRTCGKFNPLYTKPGEVAERIRVESVGGWVTEDAELLYDRLHHMDLTVCEGECLFCACAKERGAFTFYFSTSI